ncbi:hypothetical protein HK096_009288 [Nowakowskiella sp. JEL0078]|nr:hypothetical protein HK096_009288 [Nowakowskiella sp. JEL0078]
MTLNLKVMQNDTSMILQRLMKFYTPEELKRSPSYFIEFAGNLREKYKERISAFAIPKPEPIQTTSQPESTLQSATFSERIKKPTRTIPPWLNHTHIYRPAAVVQVRSEIEKKASIIGSMNDRSSPPNQSPNLKTAYPPFLAAITIKDQPKIEITSPKLESGSKLKDDKLNRSESNSKDHFDVKTLKKLNEGVAETIESCQKNINRFINLSKENKSPDLESLIEIAQTLANAVADLRGISMNTENLNSTDVTSKKSINETIFVSNQPNISVKVSEISENMNEFKSTNESDEIKADLINIQSKNIEISNQISITDDIIKTIQDANIDDQGEVTASVFSGNLSKNWNETSSTSQTPIFDDPWLKIDDTQFVTPYDEWLSPNTTLDCILSPEKVSVDGRKKYAELMNQTSVNYDIHQNLSFESPLKSKPLRVSGVSLSVEEIDPLGSKLVN